jgi:hypothetical protein
MSIKNFHHKMPIENFFKNFEIGGGAVLLLWANILSPFGINRQKRRHLRALFTFSPLVLVIRVNIIPKWRAVQSDGEG